MHLRYVFLPYICVIANKSNNPEEVFLPGCVFFWRVKLYCSEIWDVLHLNLAQGFVQIMIRNVALQVYVLVILLIIIWGLCWPINKIGLAFMPPIWYAAFRLLIGMISLFIIAVFSRKLIIPNRRDLPIVLVIGFLQMALFLSLITIGLDHVSAGRSAILVYTTPIWVMPLAILFFNEKLNKYNAIGFLLGMLGIFTLFSPWGMDWADSDALLGNGLLLLAALCWAVAILCARNMTWYRTPIELVPWQLLMGTCLVFIAAYSYQPSPSIDFNDTLIGSLLVTGVLGAAFGYWGSIVVSKELPSITVSLCFLAIPVSGLIFSALILHEPITFLIIVAMFFILTGIAFVAWGNHKQRKRNVMDGASL